MTVKLHRPDTMNAFSETMMAELIDVYQKANKNPKVKVIIVTGEGKAFCAGMDLSGNDQVFTSDESVEDFRDTGGRVSLEVYKLSKPIIAAINGAAVGIGITMTLPMDIRIVSPKAKIGFIFGQRGIGPEAASGYFLPKLVGHAKALEWLYTGRIFRAQEEEQSGLFHYMTEEPYAKAEELAKEMIQNTSPISRAFSRQLIYSMLNSSHPQSSHLIESRFLHWIADKEDVKEGIQAFKEKRRPFFPMAADQLPDFFHVGRDKND
nr:enoyl-CoA hydratase-related protein [Chryseomicrobium aureum]